MDRVGRLCSELRAALLELEPGTWAPERAAALAEELATTENACGVAKARMVTRAASCGEHRRRGFADASEWLANTTGTTTSEARRELDAARAVEQCPDTRDALFAGAVSLAQAAEIARTALAVPGSEAVLLATATTTSLGVLRDQARKVRVAAVDRDALHAEQHRRRSFRHWRDELGMVCGQFALPPEQGVPLVNAIAAEADRVRRAARKRGELESRAAHAADALVALCSSERRGTRARRAELILVCDASAYLRGRTEGREQCHVVGGGPVPVSVAREIAADAFVKAVLHDGVNIHTVAHFGRHIPAELRTALELGPVPDLDGVTCVEDGCERRYGLEWDHVDPVAHGGVTSYGNLEARCWPHHREKTARDRRAGLLRTGGDGDRAPP